MKRNQTKLPFDDNLEWYFFYEIKSAEPLNFNIRKKISVNLIKFYVENYTQKMLPFDYV